MKNLLENFDFTDKETEVYLASLSLGEATGFQIYKATNLKKPTVYYVLDELVKRNLITQTKKGAKKYYLPADPQKIQEILRTKLESFETVLPQLSAIYNIKGVSPKLRFYEGKEGLKAVYADTLNYQGEILAFASEGIFFFLGKDFLQDYLKKRVKKGISVRGIIPTTRILKRRYVEKNIKHLRKTKLISAKKYNFPIEINIYANKVAFMSFRDELGLIVESDEISTMMKMIFEYFWETL